MYNLTKLYVFIYSHVIISVILAGYYTVCMRRGLHSCMEI